MEQFGREIINARELIKQIYAKTYNQAEWIENYIHLDEEKLERVRPELIKISKLLKEKKELLIQIEQKINT